MYLFWQDKDRVLTLFMLFLLCFASKMTSYLMSCRICHVNGERDKPCIMKTTANCIVACRDQKGINCRLSYSNNDDVADRATDYTVLTVMSRVPVLLPPTTLPFKRSINCNSRPFWCVHISGSRERGGVAERSKRFYNLNDIFLRPIDWEKTR